MDTGVMLGIGHTLSDMAATLKSIERHLATLVKRGNEKAITGKAPPTPPPPSQEQPQRGDTVEEAFQEYERKKNQEE